MSREKLFDELEAVARKSSKAAVEGLDTLIAEGKSAEVEELASQLIIARAHQLAAADEGDRTFWEGEMGILESHIREVIEAKRLAVVQEGIELRNALLAGLRASAMVFGEAALWGAKATAKGLISEALG